MADIGKDIRKAGDILVAGGLVAIPTETVYGLAANAFNADAVATIFEAKQRPHFDPLIVHCSGLEKAKDLTTNMTVKALDLAEAFWPGPLTLLLKKKKAIPDLVTAGMVSVAVRVPNHQLTLELLESLNFPLVAPSANPFGYISPTSSRHVNEQLGNVIDYILEGGDCSVGIESTIVGFDKDIPTVHRLGGLEIDKIESVIGKVHTSPHSTSNPSAPGMLKSHYSPRKKVVFGDLNSLANKYKDLNKGVIHFKSPASLFSYQNEIVLSKDGDLHEAAKNLFSALRKMDNSNADIILTEEAPNMGLGLAINDRLKRAAAEKKKGQTFNNTY